MTNVFSPWADSDPYRRGHVIRAEEVNVKFEGITTAFDELAKLINQRVMLLPGSFDGSNVVDVGLVANTLLHINADGNLSAYSLTAFENNVALTAVYKEAAYASANSAGISLQQVQQLHDQVVLLESNVTSLSQQTTVAKDTAVTKAGEASASAASANDDKIAAANSASSANDDKIAAAGSASMAANHESNAKTYRDEALSYCNTASSHKDAAAGYASSASSSAGSASNSASTATTQATLAEKWAQNPENTAVESGKYSAYHWAQKAQEYAGAVDYNWSAIQGKPSTFPPSTHSHDWGQITGNKGFISGGDSTVKYGVSGLQFSNFSGSGGAGTNGSQLKNPTSDWYYHITQNHANGNGYYFDIACHFHSDSVAFRRVTGGTDNGWNYFYHTGNKPNWSDIGGKPSTFQPIRNTNYTWTGKQQYNVTADGFSLTGGASSGIEVWSNNLDSATMLFHIGGAYATYFGLQKATHRFGWGGWSAGAGFNALDSTKHYYNVGSVTLNDRRHRHTRYIAWSNSGTITIDGSAFSEGDVIEIINQKGYATLTIYCNDGTIYLPDGSSGSTHTLSKAGTVKLVRYSGGNHWMAQVY